MLCFATQVGLFAFALFFVLLMLNLLIWTQVRAAAARCLRAACAPPPPPVVPRAHLQAVL
jgi:hypothetical protein